MPRLKENTKEVILDRSLKLFSKKGFEAVSVRDIAKEVGIGNSALYKHFASKQEILDALIEQLKEKYEAQSGIVNADIRGLEAVKRSCLAMFEYQTQNEWIVNFRQLLLIEQFNNPHLASIYKEFFIDIPLKRLDKIFLALQDKELMVPGDTYSYAMELYAPFYLYHIVEYNYDELRPHFEKHIDFFFKHHFIAEKKS